HRDDDMVRVVARAAGHDKETIAHARETLDTNARANGKRKRARVLLEVVAHLVLGGEVVAIGGGERQAVEAGVSRGRKEAQRVPALAPDVADARAGVENDELDAVLTKVIPDRESGLARADDDRVDALSDVA